MPGFWKSTVWIPQPANSFFVNTSRNVCVFCKEEEAPDVMLRTIGEYFVGSDFPDWPQWLHHYSRDLFTTEADYSSIHHMEKICKNSHPRMLLIRLSKVCIAKLKLRIYLYNVPWRREMKFANALYRDSSHNRQRNVYWSKIPIALLPWIKSLIKWQGVGCWLQ